MKIDSNDFRVKEGKKVDLKKWPTLVPPFYKSQKQYEKMLREHVEELSAFQRRHYASDRYALLLIFQAMDAAGKDGAIRHVMSGVNPQGCQVFSFKAPSSEELDHDYLWRCFKSLPERGRIGIFNRSHYEECLVVRVHPEILGSQRLPADLRDDPDIFDQRLKDIRHFESYLARNGTKIIKFYLNVSKKEQRDRLLARLDEPDKNWKFELGDLKERAHFHDYQKAFQQAIRATASKHAPWYIIPADNKWFMRAAVVRAVLNELQSLDLDFPKISKAQRDSFAAARKMLEDE